MRRDRNWNARLALMCATFSCLILGSGCASYAGQPVSLPPPLWRPCQLPIPAELMTVRDAESRLMQSERALLACDAQGKGLIDSWPK